MISLREIRLSDALMVFNWRNDPYIVNLGSLRKTVTWEEHLIWLKNIISSKERKAFILEIDGMPAGQVRFDLHSKDSCFISVYLMQEFSGRGHGTQFLKLGCRNIFSEWKKVKTILALVRIDNKIGQKAFLKAGFVEDISIQDENHVGYSLARN